MVFLHLLTASFKSLYMLLCNINHEIAISDTNAPNDPKMTWNTTRSKVLHMCCISLSHQFHFFALWLLIFQILWYSRPESQISVCSALRWAIFKLQTILRQVHRMTPKWSWTLTRSKTPHIYIYVSNVPEPQIPLYFSLRPTVSDLQGIKYIYHWAPYFPIGDNGKISKCHKNVNYQISKYPKQHFCVDCHLDQV